MPEIFHVLKEVKRGSIICCEMKSDLPNVKYLHTLLIAFLSKSQTSKYPLFLCNMVWINVLQKAHVTGGGAFGRWLDHEGPEFIAVRLLGGRAQWNELHQVWGSGIWGAGIGRIRLAPSTPPYSLPTLPPSCELSVGTQASTTILCFISTPKQWCQPTLDWRFWKHELKFKLSLRVGFLRQFVTVTKY